jgi:hypothetical protein
LKELEELKNQEKKSFKSWATMKFNADFSVSAIERAALNCNSIPTEFGDLMMKIAEVNNSRSRFNSF